MATLFECLKALFKKRLNLRMQKFCEPSSENIFYSNVSGFMPVLLTR
jgi:hypothetical protein